MRINININDDLLKKLDIVSKQKCVSRSAYISFAISQKIQSDSMLENIPELVQTFQTAVELEKNRNINVAVKTSH